MRLDKKTIRLLKARYPELRNALSYYLLAHTKEEKFTWMKLIRKRVKELQQIPATGSEIEPDSDE